MNEEEIVSTLGTNVEIFPSSYFLIFVFIATVAGLIYLIVKRNQVPRPLFVALLIVLVLQIASGVFSGFAAVDVISKISSGEADDSGTE